MKTHRYQHTYRDAEITLELPERERGREGPAGAAAGGRSTAGTPGPSAPWPQRYRDTRTGVDDGSSVAATVGAMVTDTKTLLSQLRDVAEDIGVAEAIIRRATRHRDFLIREAMQLDGLQTREIATAADISEGRVYQIMRAPSGITVYDPDTYPHKRIDGRWVTFLVEDEDD